MPFNNQTASQKLCVHHHLNHYSTNAHQKSIQLLQINAEPIRNCFDAHMTTLIYKMSVTAWLISQLSFIQKEIFDTTLFLKGLHLSPASQ